MSAEALTRVESTRLSRLEEVIRHGMLTFVETGRALQEIRDERLYRATHERFEDYCSEVWGWSASRSRQFIGAANVVESVKSVTNGNTPTSERVARPLIELDPDEQRAAWKESVETAPAGRVTAEHVQSVVRRYRDKQPRAIEAPPERASQLSALAGSKFGCIYADPPWQYGNQATRAATDNHYATMTVEQIAALPVAGLAAADAHLHLWTTNAFLFDAARIIEAWGFVYKSVFVWVKPSMGIGNYWRVSHEFLLLGVRGSCPFLDRSCMSWLQAKRGRHSAKPERVRAMVEKVSPGPRLELFARKQYEGWTSWGNEVASTLWTQAATK